MQDNSVFIVWKSEYNIGIPIIDEQHRGIVSIINTLHYAIRNDYVHRMLVPIIDMLHSYTKTHFHIEEAIFAHSDFPEVSAHKALHKELSSKLTTVGLHSMMEKDAYKLMEFLKSWWIEHICEIDIRYRAYIAEQNEDL